MKKFEIIDIGIREKYRSEIPGEITMELIKNFDADQFPSGMIDDFFMEYLNKDDVQNISSDVSDLITNSQQFHKIIQKISEKYKNYPEFWNDIKINEIKDKIIGIMQAIGASEEDRQKIIETKINFIDNTETSRASVTGDWEVTISFSQIIRKSLDGWGGLQKMIKKDVSFEDLLKLNTKRVIGHELGHMVDRVLMLRKRIDSDLKFINENTSERIAEVFGYLQLDEYEKEIAKLESLLNVKKVNELWNAIKEYNARNKNSIDLFALFSKIEHASTDDFLNKLIRARKYLYVDAAPENYALPYGIKDLMDLYKK